MDLYERLQAEQRRLRSDVDMLKQQVAQLQQQVGEEQHKKPADLPGAAPSERRRHRARHVEALYEQLPPRFTVEDLISISEQMDVNVFQTYQDLQVLILTGRVAQHDDVFEKRLAGTSSSSDLSLSSGQGTSFNHD